MRLNTIVIYATLSHIMLLSTGIFVLRISEIAHSINALFDVLCIILVYFVHVTCFLFSHLKHFFYLLDSTSERNNTSALVN